ncbi:MAG: glycosyltransferase family 4 protein, partial [bacterium]|nr:glycosyltransferase family 4 protein [bacterium]
MWAKIGLLPFLGAFVLQTLRYMNVTDVYHAQWIVSGLAAVAGQSIHRKPVVLTVRGSDLNLFQGKLTQRIFRYVFDRVSLVTTVSEKLREKILSFGVAPEKVVTLPNGIDSQTFCPEPDNSVRQQSSISPDRSTVLWIGRFISIKGVEFLIQAIPEVVSRAPNTLFVFIGGGELEREMRRKAEELGITGQTHFTGKIHAREIPGWLQAADVFVLPSLNEGR